jgi:hypothetical protein
MSAISCAAMSGSVGSGMRPVRQEAIVENPYTIEKNRMPQWEKTVKEQAGIH